MPLNINSQPSEEPKYFLFQAVHPEEIKEEKIILGKTNNPPNIVFGTSWRTGDQVLLRLEMEIRGNTEKDVMAEAKEIAKGFPPEKVGIAKTKVFRTQDGVRYRVEKIIPLSEKSWQ